MTSFVGGSGFGDDGKQQRRYDQRCRVETRRFEDDEMAFQRGWNVRE